MQICEHFAVALGISSAHPPFDERVEAGIFVPSPPRVSVVARLAATSVPPAGVRREVRSRWELRFNGLPQVYSDGTMATRQAG